MLIGNYRDMVSWHRGTGIRATNHTHLVVCLLSLSHTLHYRKPRGQSGGDERVVKVGRGCCDKEKWRVRISGVSDEACDRYFAANKILPSLGTAGIESIVRKYSESSRCSRSEPMMWRVPAG
jgi:hypothetical protein